MPFPTHVLVTLTKEGSFSCPPEEFREKMMAALKIYFLKKLEEEPWSDVEPALCYEEQRIPLHPIPGYPKTWERKGGVFQIKVLPFSYQLDGQ